MRPMLLALIGAAAGAAVGVKLPAAGSAGTLLGGTCAVTLVAAWLLRARPRASWAVFLVGLGLSCWWRASVLLAEAEPSSVLHQSALQPDVEMGLRLHILDRPTPAEDGLSMPADLLAMDRNGTWIPVTGRVEVAVADRDSSGWLGVGRGTELTCPGRVYRANAWRAEATPIIFQVSRRGGEQAWILAKGPPRIERVGHGGGSLRASGLWALKELALPGWFVTMLGPELLRESEALLAALTFGERSWMSSGFEGVVRLSGLQHVIAVSGSHVGIWIVVVFGAVWRMFGRRAAVWATMASVIVLWLITGGAPPVKRAMLAAVLYCTAELAGRPVLLEYSLVLSAIGVLLWNPLQIMDIGAQLSYLAVFGILAFGPGMSASLRIGWRWLRLAFVSGFTAQMTLLPLLILYFGRIPLLGMGHGLLTMPPLFVLFATIPAPLLLSGVWPQVASLLMVLPYTMAVLLAWIFRNAGEFALATARAPRLGPLPLGIALLALAAGMSAALIADARRRHLARVAAAGLAVCWTWCWSWQALPKAHSDQLHADFLDVGQGHATLFRLPGGLSLLIDAGPGGRGTSAGQRVVIPKADRERLAGIDAIAATHPDADHIGGIEDVLRGLPVGAVWWGSPRSPAGMEWDVWWLTRRIGTEFEELRRSPGPWLAAQADNERSGVFRVRYGGVSFLVTGDLAAGGEASLIERYGVALRSTVLLAGHHGDHKATSAAFLAAVQPEAVVIGCGRWNRFGHPRSETLRRIEDAGIRRIYRTDRQGSIAMTTDGREIRVSCLQEWRP